MIDTGAAEVTVPQEEMLAAYPDILSRAEPLQLRLADGSSVRGYSAVVPSVWLGPWEFKDVPVAFCPGCARLIGMSLLRGVQMSIESHGELFVMRVRR
jgi:predicted aspartyl protease